MEKLLSELRKVENEIEALHEVNDNLEKLRDFQLKQIAENADKVSTYIKRSA